jgi:hypothetical protein
MAYKDKHDPRAREARLRHYYKNKEQYYARNSIRKAQLRELINELKNVPCKDCGNSYPPYIMQFDHTGTDKKYNVSQMAVLGSERKIRLEASKCEVVCANCHAIRTYKRRTGLM